PVPVEVDPGDLTDLDSGDPDLVALLQPGGLTELGRVGVARPEERQAGEGESSGGGEQHHQDAEQTGHRRMTTHSHHSPPFAWHRGAMLVYSGRLNSGISGRFRFEDWPDPAITSIPQT